MNRDEGRLQLALASLQVHATNLSIAMAVALVYFGLCVAAVDDKDRWFYGLATAAALSYCLRAGIKMRARYVQAHTIVEALPSDGDVPAASR